MNACAVNPPRDSSGRGHILVVDDEDALLEIYTAILQRHFEVTAARNAAEAERRLNTILSQYESLKAYLRDIRDEKQAGETPTPTPTQAGGTATPVPTSTIATPTATTTATSTPAAQ